LLIRGISDHADTAKGDLWQVYAANVASAYLTALFQHLPGTYPSTLDSVQEAHKPDSRNASSSFYSLASNSKFPAHSQLEVCYQEFLADARTIEAAPHLFGRWLLASQSESSEANPPVLSTTLFAKPLRPDATEVSLLPTANYPQEPPKILLSRALSDQPPDVIRDYLARLPVVIRWQQFLAARGNRLVYIVDDIIQVQSSEAAFVADTREITSQDALQGWTLRFHGEHPVLSYIVSIERRPVELEVKPSKRYPCTPPQFSIDHGNPAFAGSLPEMHTPSIITEWRSLLRRDGYLGAFLGARLKELSVCRGGDMNL